MTKQLTAQLTFYLNNLEKRENGLEKSHQLWKYRGLRPFLKVRIKRQEKGIKKVKLDIKNMQTMISLRLKNGQIFPISLE